MGAENVNFGEMLLTAVAFWCGAVAIGVLNAVGFFSWCNRHVVLSVASAYLRRLRIRRNWPKKFDPFACPRCGKRRSIDP